VVTTPIKKGAPGFLVNHAVKMSNVVPTISQSIGRWVRFQTIGANIQFRIAHMEEKSKIADKSLLLK